MFNMKQKLDSFSKNLNKKMHIIIMVFRKKNVMDKDKA